MVSLRPRTLQPAPLADWRSAAGFTEIDKELESARSRS
jgi:hypothetical protein